MADLVSRSNDLIAPVISWDNDIEIVGGNGSYVTSVDGVEYLDFACGIAVGNLGHQHPGVKAAVLAQIDKLWHAGGVFRYETLVGAAERLREITPDGIEKFFFMNSGAEAVEGAIKLARKTTGRQGIIVFRGGFHGRTMGSVSYTTSKAAYRQGYHPLVGSVFVTPFPHPYRWGMSQEAANELALNELRLTLKHEITPGEVACFLIEPLQGEGGYYPASREFLQAIRDIATEHNIKLVMDEVQTGFGRTGEWFTSQVYDVRPDILVMGKAIANGFPLSAVGASSALLDAWPPGSHGSTYGGNPIACAASIATVDGLRNVIPGVKERSEHAFARFREMQSRYSVIGDVRGLGLMIGIELVGKGRTPNPQAWNSVGAYARENNMFILNCGPDANVIRFIPPLNVAPEDLDKGIDILDAALGSYEGSTG
ncbi:5-aminovalerate aminotransferase DavT [bacterium BMS3Bbin02]|nr:5-aminovalerate aminotransferase DavT [bacterium BMS3Bbin02]